MLQHEFGLSKPTVKTWRERIDRGGVGAIDRPRRNYGCTQGFKVKVVEAFLAGEGDYKEPASRFGVRSFAQIRDWAKRYLEGGEGALVRRASGRGRRTEEGPGMLEQRFAHLEMESEILKRMAASAAALGATGRSTASSSHWGGTTHWKRFWTRTA